MNTKPQKLTPDTLRELADTLASKGRLPPAGVLGAHALAWEGLQADYDAARGKQVTGFYLEEHPQFRQGEPAHELEELVTAEDCTSMVRAITEMQAEVRALLEELDHGFQYLEPKERPAHAVFRYNLIPLELLNKVRKRVDLPELK